MREPPRVVGKSKFGLQAQDVTWEDSGNKGYKLGNVSRNSQPGNWFRLFDTEREAGYSQGCKTHPSGTLTKSHLPSALHMWTFSLLTITIDTIVLPVLQWVNQVTEGLSNLFKVMQLTSHQGRMWTLAVVCLTVHAVNYLLSRYIGSSGKNQML